MSRAIVTDGPWEPADVKPSSTRRCACGCDAAVAAARQPHSRRVRVIDMTPFVCSARRCLPVLGGALVYKDREHMTDVFSTSLGPYLLRAIDRL